MVVAVEAAVDSLVAVADSSAADTALAVGALAGEAVAAAAGAVASAAAEVAASEAAVSALREGEVWLPASAMMRHARPLSALPNKITDVPP